MKRVLIAMMLVSLAGCAGTTASPICKVVTVPGLCPTPVPTPAS